MPLPWILSKSWTVSDSAHDTSRPCISRPPVKVEVDYPFNQPICLTDAQELACLVA